MLSSAGTGTTPFKFGGGNGCQTDSDTLMVLMGHRYYDSRTGRFLTQDPAGSGDNWYAYADNDPVRKIDPSGLLTQQEAEEGQQAYNNNQPGLYDFYSVTNGDYANAKYLYTKVIGFDYISFLFAHPSMFFNFPGNSGSHFMSQPIKAAQEENRKARFNYPARVHWLTSHVGKGNLWDLKKDVIRSENPILGLTGRTLATLCMEL